jgi:hypothetical protein
LIYHRYGTATTAKPKLKSGPSNISNHRPDAKAKINQQNI